MEATDQIGDVLSFCLIRQCNDNEAKFTFAKREKRIFQRVDTSSEAGGHRSPTDQRIILAEALFAQKRIFSEKGWIQV